MKKTLFALLIVALALPAIAEVRIDETRQVAADATVTVENISGSLRLTGWDKTEVQITGTLGRGLEKVDITGSGSRLDVRVIYPHDCHDCGGADLEIRVPVGCRLEVNAVSADIEAGDLSGEGRFESVSGDRDRGHQRPQPARQERERGRHHSRRRSTGRGQHRERHPHRPHAHPAGGGLRKRLR